MGDRIRIVCEGETDLRGDDGGVGKAWYDLLGIGDGLDFLPGFESG